MLPTKFGFKLVVPQYNLCTKYYSRPIHKTPKNMQSVRFAGISAYFNKIRIHMVCIYLKSENIRKIYIYIFKVDYIF